MEFTVTSAGDDRDKLEIRGTLWNGEPVKFPGHRDKKIAEMMCKNIASLNRSRHLEEPPDPKLLPWINGLSEKEANKYSKYELLDRRFLDKRRPINDLIDEFAIHLKAVLEDRSKWAKKKPVLVRRIFAAIGPHANFENLDQDDVHVALKNMTTLCGRRKGQPISQKTKREYIFAIKAFCKWMVKKRGATKNPVEEMIAPSAKGAPVVNRRPMKIAEFSKLASYLRTAPLSYPHQLFAWTPEERLMLYWMAVMTGFRANELRSLTRASINFDADPVTVTVEGWVAKNRTKATVPIDAELVPALKDHAQRRAMTEPLLRLPSSEEFSYILYRDLDAAGVRRKFDDGTHFDFHTLRSTAIYWWLKEKRLDVLEVQKRARLKTLTLVQEYVRNHVPDYGKPIDAPPEKLDFSLPIWRGC